MAADAVSAAGMDMALALNANDATLLATKGDIYRAQKKTIEARAILTKAMEADPSSSMAYAIRAELEAQQGWLSRAND